MLSVTCVCYVAVFLAPLSAASVTLDLGGFEELDIASGVDKASLDLKWVISFTAEAGAGTKLRVEGPTSLNVSVGEDPQSPTRAALTLEYGCLLTSPSRPDASDALASLANLPLTMILALVGLCFHRVHHSILLTSIVVMVICLSVIALGAVPCEGPTILTLVLSPEQWGIVEYCELCPSSIQHDSTKFKWRPPCNITSAAASLDQVGASCETVVDLASELSACSSIHLGCDTNGWCQASAPKAECSIPVEVAHTCLHSHFKERLLDHVNATGARFLQALLECEIRPVIGRPYTTRDGSLRAPAQWEDGECPWSTPGSESQTSSQSATTHDISLGALEGWTQSDASAAAEAWLHHGQEEHASIASFSRFSLDLLRFAAPPSLIEAAHAAAIDEVRHAKLAFKLAASFQGQIKGTLEANVGVGPFPASTVELSESLGIVATRTLEEGCIGESSASAGLAFALDALREGSPVNSVLLELLADEARHAALAWATLRWALRAGATVKLPGQEPGHSSTDLDASIAPSSLAWAGRVPGHTTAKLEKLVREVWVYPWVAALSNGEAVPDVVAEVGNLGKAISKAAQLVRSELEKMTSGGANVV